MKRKLSIFSFLTLFFSLLVMQGFNLQQAKAETITSDILKLSEKRVILTNPIVNTIKLPNGNILYMSNFGTREFTIINNLGITVADKITAPIDLSYYDIGTSNIVFTDGANFVIYNFNGTLVKSLTTSPLTKKHRYFINDTNSKLLRVEVDDTKYTSAVAIIDFNNVVKASITYTSSNNSNTNWSYIPIYDAKILTRNTKMSVMTMYTKQSSYVYMDLSVVINFSTNVLSVGQTVSYGYVLPMQISSATAFINSDDSVCILYDYSSNSKVIYNYTSTGILRGTPYGVSQSVEAIDVQPNYQILKYYNGTYNISKYDINGSIQNSISQDIDVYKKSATHVAYSRGLQEFNNNGQKDVIVVYKLSDLTAFSISTLSAQYIVRDIEYVNGSFYVVTNNYNNGGTVSLYKINLTTQAMELISVLNGIYYPNIVVADDDKTFVVHNSGGTNTGNVYSYNTVSNKLSDLSNTRLEYYTANVTSMISLGNYIYMSNVQLYNDGYICCHLIFNSATGEYKYSNFAANMNTGSFDFQELTKAKSIIFINKSSIGVNTNELCFYNPLELSNFTRDTITTGKLYFPITMSSDISKVNVEIPEISYNKSYSILTDAQNKYYIQLTDLPNDANYNIKVSYTLIDASATTKMTSSDKIPFTMTKPTLTKTTVNKTDMTLTTNYSLLGGEYKKVVTITDKNGYTLDKTFLTSDTSFQFTGLLPNKQYYVTEKIYCKGSLNQDIILTGNELTVQTASDDIVITRNHSEDETTVYLHFDKGNNYALPQYKLFIVSEGFDVNAGIGTAYPVLGSELTNVLDIGLTGLSPKQRYDVYVKEKGLDGILDTNWRKLFTITESLTNQSGYEVATQLAPLTVPEILDATSSLTRSKMNSILYSMVQMGSLPTTEKAVQVSIANFGYNNNLYVPNGSIPTGWVKLTGTSNIYYSVQSGNIITAICFEYTMPTSIADLIIK